MAQWRRLDGGRGWLFRGLVVPLVCTPGTYAFHGRPSRHLFWSCVHVLGCMRVLACAVYQHLPSLAVVPAGVWPRRSFDCCTVAAQVRSYLVNNAGCFQVSRLGVIDAVRTVNRPNVILTRNCCVQVGNTHQEQKTNGVEECGGLPTA